MAPTWQIWLKDQAGVRLALLDYYRRFSIGRSVNGLGAFALELSGLDTHIASLALDGQLEFYRGNPAMVIDPALEFEALIRDWEEAIDADGRTIYTVSGCGYNELLRRRVIEASSGSAGAAKDGPAETVIKEFVEEQCGPTAGARAIAGLSVELDAMGGGSVRLSRAYRNVYEVCLEIAAVGGGDFAVIGVGPATYEFQWHGGQLGTDRSASVVFALEYGNMGSPKLVHRRSSEITAVLVGGEGDGAARVTTWRIDYGRESQSPINLREVFIDQRQEPDADGLITAGNRALNDGRSPYQLSFDVLQVPSCLYGYHYFLGDLVTVRFKTYIAVQQVKAVEFVIDPNGEQLKVTLSEPPEEYGT
jgi:hypothetical protein